MFASFHFTLFNICTYFMRLCFYFRHCFIIVNFMILSVYNQGSDVIFFCFLFSLRMYLGRVCNNVVNAHTDTSTNTITLFIALSRFIFSHRHASQKNLLSQKKSNKQKVKKYFLNKPLDLIKLRLNFSNKMKQPHFYFILLYLEVSQPFSKPFSKSN
jgi:hypothetical protein